MQAVQRFAHRTNILKYQKMLVTYLTAEERRFVERRMVEEQSALRQLGDVASIDKATYAA